MSRTYRRKSGDQTNLNWATHEFKRLPGTWHWERVPLDPQSKEYKASVARYYSDRQYTFKEPGPSWFRRLFTERPQRRHAKRELNKYLLDPDYEVILNEKDPLEYWT